MSLNVFDLFDHHQSEKFTYAQCSYRSGISCKNTERVQIFHSDDDQTDRKRLDS